MYLSSEDAELPLEEVRVSSCYWCIDACMLLGICRYLFGVERVGWQREATIERDSFRHSYIVEPEPKIYLLIYWRR